MKKKMRKLVVGEEVFFWRFSQAWTGKFWQSKLTIRSAQDKAVQIVVNFQTEDTYFGSNPLQTGLLMQKDGQQFEFNLNRPKYVAELLMFLFANKPALKQQKNYTCQDGNELLRQMGYLPVIKNRALSAVLLFILLRRH